MMGSFLNRKNMAKNLVLSGQGFDKLVIDLRKIIDAAAPALRRLQTKP
jgi:hypothetical protein